MSREHSSGEQNDKLTPGPARSRSAGAYKPVLQHVPERGVAHVRDLFDGSQNIKHMSSTRVPNVSRVSICT